MRILAAGAVRATVCRMVFILVAAGLLAACDRCGDFFPPIKLQVCKEDTPIKQ